MLRFENVSFGYEKQRTVLSNLSLEISGGSVALVGANGAGKTTLTRLAIALEQPSEGQVFVAGRTTRGLEPEDLAVDAAYLFQHVDRQLFARRVIDEVAFGPQNLGVSKSDSRQRALESLERVGLKDEADTHPFDLSPAQRKLVGLASALAQKPRLLILDEPTQGLDLDHLLMVAAVLREERSAGTTTLAVTHDLAFVAECFDRVVRLESGRVVADLDARQVVSDARLTGDLGLRVPPVPALSKALALSGFPIRFHEAVAAVSDIAANRESK